ncbi:hypothetical protein [Mycolicibacterium sp. YH-1]|uniref:hypothetical protein n=1 Tax=Mycolicibacterium sp. YH-1 TaxID=2908837 RepID=UPI001F4BD1A4|nr:hypothetical protein [Mycolicibacterium sp. YH-1]UNB53135.1 hypothetical protein L0M16_01805 [Mycolicibacterium sp. YH-1]
MAYEIADAIVRRNHSVVAAFNPRLPKAPLADVYVDSVDGLLAAKPDVIVHGTPRDGDVTGQVLNIVDAGVPVVSISGLTYLRATDQAGADAIDRAARQHNVAVIGAGINPGFVLDLVPIFFSGSCVEVTAVHASRTFDIAPYGDSVMQMYGIGLSEAEFHAAVNEGRIKLHSEIVQSACLVAEVLGLTVTTVEEEKLPILEDGSAVGFRHICRAEPNVQLEMVGVRSPVGGGDTIVNISGDPNVTVRMSGGLANQGGRVVAARVVHVLDWLVNEAPAGLRSPADLPVALGYRTPTAH